MDSTKLNNITASPEVSRLTDFVSADIQMRLKYTNKCLYRLLPLRRIHFLHLNANCTVRMQEFSDVPVEDVLPKGDACWPTGPVLVERLEYQARQKLPAWLRTDLITCNGSATLNSFNRELFRFLNVHLRHLNMVAFITIMPFRLAFKYLRDLERVEFPLHVFEDHETSVKDFFEWAAESAPKLEFIKLVTEMYSAQGLIRCSKAIGNTLASHPKLHMQFVFSCADGPSKVFMKTLETNLRPRFGKAFNICSREFPDEVKIVSVQLSDPLHV